MDADQIDWQPAPPDSEDAALILAYVQTGVPLDSLVYTDHFKRLAALAGVSDTSDIHLRSLYLRLLGLRKRGLLPRLYGNVSAAG